MLQATEVDGNLKLTPPACQAQALRPEPRVDILKLPLESLQRGLRVLEEAVPNGAAAFDELQ